MFLFDRWKTCFYVMGSDESIDKVILNAVASLSPSFWILGVQMHSLICFQYSAFFKKLEKKRLEKQIIGDLLSTK